MKKNHDSSVPSNSLLVYPPTGLIRLHCPIQAICARSVEPFEVGDLVFITGISFDKVNPLLYQVQGQLYGHQYFQILTTKSRKL